MYEEQTSSPSPMQGDQYGDDASGGLDLDALAAECGPLNLFNMLYSQVAKVMEENEWLKQENVQLRDENYELQSRLAYALQEPSTGDTPPVLSTSASPEYLSPHQSPRLTRSVTTDPQQSLNSTSASHYSDESLTKTAPIRSTTERPRQPSHTSIMQSTPSPSPSVERVEEDTQSKMGEMSEQRSEVQADGGEADHSSAVNGDPSSSTVPRPTGIARTSSPSLNGSARTSSANSVASSVSSSPVGSATPTLSSSSTSSPAHAASKQATKRKPSVSIKAGELSPSKGSTMTSLSSTLSAVSFVSSASSAAPASASALSSSARKTPVSALSSAGKSASPANAAVVTNGGKKAGAVTPRKKSATGTSGKAAIASKSGKGNFFTSASGGSDPLDQFLSQAVSGLSGLCSTALNGKPSASAASTAAEKSKVPSASSFNNNINGPDKKDSRTASASASASRDAINVLAASLHLKPKDRDRQAEGHSPGGSGVSGSGRSRDEGDSKEGAKGGGVLDDLKPYAPSFGVGSNKAKHDNDSLFL